MPALAAVLGRQRVEVAVEPADHQEIALHRRAARPAQRVVAALPHPAVAFAQMLLPDRAAAGRVDRFDRAIDARRVQASIDHRRRDACAGIAGAAALPSVHRRCTCTVGVNSVSGVGGSTLSFLPRLLIQSQPPSAAPSAMSIGIRMERFMSRSPPSTPPARSAPSRDCPASSARRRGSAPAHRDAKAHPDRRRARRRCDPAAPGCRRADHP